MPIADADGVPEWLHLIPATGELQTHDNRGPYRVRSLQAIVDAFRPGSKLVLDENHSTDLAAPRGESAPARGWIVEMQARADGVWGKVDWTGEGRRLMEDKAYRGLSPVIIHDAAKNVHGIARASLTNKPNLVGLVALHSENDGMDWLEKLRELLGLGGDVDEAAVLAELATRLKAPDKAAEGSEAPQAQQDSEAILALQSELADTTTALNELRDERKREKATAFVDGAIAAKHVGVKPLRDRYISMHMQNPADVEAMIGALPKVADSTHAGNLPPEADADGMTAANRAAIALLGVDEEAYKANLAASGKKEEAL